MKKKNLEKITILILIITFILDFFFNKNNIGYYLEPIINIIYILSITLIIFIGNINQTKLEKKKKFKYYFIFYILLIIYLTFNRAFNYNRNMYNLIPFNTILNIDGDMYLLKTLILNFILYMPFAIILPNMSERLKSNRNYIITIIFMPILIKTLGYIFNYSVFDIDDILLNVIGSTIIFFIIKYTNLKEIINKLYYDSKIKEKIQTIIYVIVLVTFIGISLFKLCGSIGSIYQIYYRDFSNFSCYKKEKTYITTIGNYKYYSECDYKNSYVIAGNIALSIPKYVESWFYKDSDNKKLHIIKEKIIDNIRIYKKDNVIKKIFNYNEMRHMYLVNIDYITLTKNNINYKIEDEKDNDIDFYKLVNLPYSDIINYKEYWCILYVGENFNIIRISYLNDSPSYEFIIPKDYVINEDKIIRLYKFARENK